MIEIGADTVITNNGGRKNSVVAVSAITVKLLFLLVHSCTNNHALMAGDDIYNGTWPLCHDHQG